MFYHKHHLNDVQIQTNVGREIFDATAYSHTQLLSIH